MALGYVCVGCDSKYGLAPASRRCPKCGGAVTETASGPTAEDILERNLRFASTAVEKGFLTPEQIMELVGSDELSQGANSIETVVQKRGLLSAAQVVEILHDMGEEPDAERSENTEEPAPPSEPPPAQEPAPASVSSQSTTDLDPSVTRLKCNSCGAKLKIRNYLSTKKYTCPMCKSMLSPATPTAAVAPPTAAPATSGGPTRPPTVRTVVKGPSPFKKPDAPKPPANQSRTQKLPPVAEPPPEEKPPERKADVPRGLEKLMKMRPQPPISDRLPEPLAPVQEKPAATEQPVETKSEPPVEPPKAVEEKIEEAPVIPLFQMPTADESTPAKPEPKPLEEKTEMPPPPPSTTIEASEQGHPPALSETPSPEQSRGDEEASPPAMSDPSTSVGQGHEIEASRTEQPTAPIEAVEKETEIRPAESPREAKTEIEPPVKIDLPPPPLPEDEEKAELAPPEEPPKSEDEERADLAPEQPEEPELPTPPPAPSLIPEEEKEEDTATAANSEERPTSEVPIIPEGTATAATDASTAMTQQIPRRRGSWFLVVLLLAALGALGYFNVWPMIQQSMERQDVLERGRDAYIKGQYKEARDLLKKAIDLGAVDPETKKAYDDCVERLKEPPPPDEKMVKREQIKPLVKQAQDHLEQALKLRTGKSWNPDEWNMRLASGIEAATRADTILPDQPEVLMLRGRLRVLMRRREEGLQDLQKAAKANPENPNAWFLLGLCQFEQLMSELDRAGDPSELRWIRRRQKEQMENLSNLMNQAAGDDALKRRVEAIKVFIQGDFQETIRQCEGAVNNNDFFFWLMAASYMETGRYDAAVNSINSGLEAAPFDAMLLATAARALDELNRAKDLLDITQRGLEIQPGAPLFILRRGRALVEVGQSDEGLRELGRATELSPRDPIVWTARALAFMKLNRLQEALEDLNKALGLETDFEPAYDWRAVVQATLGAQEAADADLKKAEELDAKSPLLMFARAQVLLVRKDPAGALKALNDSLEQALTSHALSLRAQLRMEQNDAKGAEEDLTQLIARTGSLADLHFRRAQARSRLGDKPGESSDLDRAIALDPHLGRAYFVRAQRRAEAGQADDALKDLRHAEEDGVSDAELYLLRGRLREQKNELREAADDYTRALEKNPKMAAAFMARALARDRLNNTPGAIEDLSTVLLLDGKHFDAILARGRFRAKAGDPIGALEDLAKALALKPDDPAALFERGAALFRQSEWEKSIEDLTKVLAANDKLAPALRLRGEAFFKLQRYAEALKDLQRAVELDPSLEPVLKPLIEEAKNKAGY
jgi:tetratricopeptide (TPR) repeat protein